jgi:hypothetical protein
MPSLKITGPNLEAEYGQIAAWTVQDLLHQNAEISTRYSHVLRVGHQASLRSGYTTAYQRTFVANQFSFGDFPVTVDTTKVGGVSNLWQIDILDAAAGGLPVRVFRGILIVSAGLRPIPESP